MLPKWLDPRSYSIDLPVPRRETRNKRHKLHDILMIVLSRQPAGDVNGHAGASLQRTGSP